MRKWTLSAAIAFSAVGPLAGAAHADESVDALVQRCSLVQGLSADELNSCLVSLRAIVPMSAVPGVDELLRVIGAAITQIDGSPSRLRRGTADTDDSGDAESDRSGAPADADQPPETTSQPPPR